MEVTVTVPKESYELISGIARAIKKIKIEVEDNGGWNAADDIAGIVSVAVTDLIPALQGADKVKDELAVDKALFMKGAMVGLTELVDVFFPEETSAPKLV